MEPRTLITERLTVRPYLPSDIAEMHAACQDPAIQHWIAVPVPYGLPEAETFVTETAPRGWLEDTEYNFTVRLGADGPLVAAVGVHRRGDFAHEIGYWTAPGHRGKGYMTEAVRAVARWAFTDVGCLRLIWRAGVGNTASRAVAEKAGFIVEGVHRAGMEHRETLRDCWIGALLPSDLGLPSRLPYLPAPRRDA
ncbi:GNAT family N-acetyltransferase [Streptomyces sp. NPDC002138]|uniref:GNAT family N-acetyltransferase n=1 Tax=Streptomyces sp. NPDC002138 TaxID=3154410 RepID=UPI00332E55DC